MVDREKVIKSLRVCSVAKCCIDCPYVTHGIECVEALHLDVLELLREQPEQKHGHWKLVQDYDDEHWQCSACGCEWYLADGNPEENNMHYCPECGAKMDEEVMQDADE